MPGTLVTITGGLPEGSRDIEAARGRAKERLAEIIPHAAATGVRLALEPLHPMVCGYRSIMSTLKEANDWLDELDAGDVLGIAFDTYAVWWEPYVEGEIARAGSADYQFSLQRLAAGYQACQARSGDVGRRRDRQSPAP